MVAKFAAALAELSPAHGHDTAGRGRFSLQPKNTTASPDWRHEHDWCVGAPVKPTGVRVQSCNEQIKLSISLYFISL
jgi:hypothetical protein